MGVPALRLEHERFVTEYLKTGNATEAYLTAYPGTKANSAATLGSRLLKKVEVDAEIARRRADLAARNDITLDGVIKRLKTMAFTDITEFLSGGPGAWDKDKVAAVQAYDAGGPQSSEKVKLHDQPKLLLELWDRLFPDQGKAPPPAVAVENTVNVSIDKIMLALKGPLGRTIDVTPEAP